MMILHRVAPFVLLLGLAAARRASACDSDNDCAGGKTCTGGECRMPASSNEPTGVERPNTLIVGAEHLFGYAVTTSTAKSKDSEPPVTATTTQSHFGLLVTNATSALNVPRIAFDLNAAYGITVGGAIGYASSSRETETEVGGGKSKSEGPTASAMLVAPRVGYLTMSGNVGFWGKVGLTYFSSTDKATAGGTAVGTTTIETTGTGLSAQIEPTLMLAPIDHVMLSVGLHLNVPLSGSVTTKQSGATSSSAEFDTKLSSYGLTTGLHVWF
jgi:hypothetical protein